MAKKEKSGNAAPAPKEIEGGWKGKAYGIAGKFEQLVNAAAAPLPSPRIRVWLEGFFRPEETYDKVEKGASLSGIAATLLIFYVAYSLIFFIFMLALTSSLPSEDLLAMGLQAPADTAQMALGALVVSPIASTFFALFAFAVVFASAKLMGGKGNYVKQANSMALVLCGSNVLLLASMCVAFAVFTPSFILRGSPFFGTIASIVTSIVNIPVLLLCLAILLYSVYAHYLVVKKAHSLSSWRAFGAMAIAAAVIVIVDILISVALA